MRRRQVSPPGHASSLWDRLVRTHDPVTIESLVPLTGEPRALLVASAHPDDETLGAGRLVSQWRRTVGQVSALLATAGEACLDHLVSSKGSAQHRMAQRRLAQHRMAQRRLAEWEAAMACLKVGDHFCLELPDGRLEQYEPALADQLRRRLDAVRGGVAVAAPCRIDPHPDHRAVGRAAALVAKERGIALLEYPVWLTFWSDPSELGHRRLVAVRTDGEAESDRLSALACFESQLSPLADDLEPVVPPAMLRHHREQRLVVGAFR